MSDDFTDSPCLTGPVWDKILDKALVTSRSVRVREQLFELLSAAWLRKPALQPRLRPCLLAFLADASAALRGRALEFWHRELPKDVPGRLKALLLDGAAATADVVRGCMAVLGRWDEITGLQKCI